MGRRALALAALTIGLLGGCTDGADRAGGGAEDDGGGATGAPWHDEVTGAPAAGTVGAGGPCPLPVTFDLAEGWQAAAIEAPDPGDELGIEVAEALTRRGGSTVRCELDGRAVTPGFLRVWTVDGTGIPARQALEAFVDAGEGLTEPQYRETRPGDLDVVEATWLSRRMLADEDLREWALAVQVGDQTVLVEASSTSFGEPIDLLPAYRLARDTLAGPS
ncbi:lipoprotein [Micromonospora sp. NPDC051296]|uniref:lipoprotein n=1 Tax=Micromonospora sp. NPDC051296 TaxID=3155046 RepID=UPI003446A19B